MKSALKTVLSSSGKIHRTEWSGGRLFDRGPSIVRVYLIEEHRLDRDSAVN